MTGRTDTFGGKKRHLTLARTDFRDRLAGLPVHQIAKPAYLSLVLVLRQGERRREREKDEETEMNAAGKIELPFHESDTPRGAGGLMSWTASKAVGHWFRRRARARLCQQFRTTRLLHPRCLVRGCIGGLAPTQIQPWIRHSRELKNARL